MSPVAHEASRSASEPRVGKSGAAVLLAWAACMVVLGAVVVGRHALVQPPPPPADPVLAASLSALKVDQTESLVVHVLYTHCRTAQKVAAHLVGSTRPSGAHEVVLLVGKDDLLAERLRSRGFRVVSATEEELSARYHVSSAPTLVVLGEGRDVRYVGGYTRESQGSDPQDLEIMARAQSDVVEPLPIAGCAAEKSSGLRIDPSL